MDVEERYFGSIRERFVEREKWRTALAATRAKRARFALAIRRVAVALGLVTVAAALFVEPFRSSQTTVMAIALYGFGAGGLVAPGVLRWFIHDPIPPLELSPLQESFAASMYAAAAIDRFRTAHLEADAREAMAGVRVLQGKHAYRTNSFWAIASESSRAATLFRAFPQLGAPAETVSRLNSLAGLADRVERAIETSEGLDIAQRTLLALASFLYVAMAAGDTSLPPSALMRSSDSSYGLDGIAAAVASLPRRPTKPEAPTDKKPSRLMQSLRRDSDFMVFLRWWITFTLLAALITVPLHVFVIRLSNDGLAFTIVATPMGSAVAIAVGRMQARRSRQRPTKDA